VLLARGERRIRGSVGRQAFNAGCWSARCFGLFEILEQAVVHAVEREFESIADAQLIVDFAKVVLDNLLGGTDFLSDVLVAQALRNAGDDPQFFWR
jgi:hypothetical protein